MSYHRKHKKLYKNYRYKYHKPEEKEDLEYLSTKYIDSPTRSDNNKSLPLYRELKGRIPTGNR